MKYILYQISGLSMRKKQVIMLITNFILFDAILELFYSIRFRDIYLLYVSNFPVKNQNKTINKVELLFN